MTRRAVTTVPVEPLADTVLQHRARTTTIDEREAG